MSVKKKEELFTTSDGAQIYTEIYGQGKNKILLINGIACPINHWRYQIENFAKTSQVLCFQIRGHHQSSIGSEGVALKRLAQDVIELKRKFFKSQACSLIGHSYGAPIGIQATLLAPEDFQNLVIVNGFYKNPFTDLISQKIQLTAIDYLREFALHAPTLSEVLWKSGNLSPLFKPIASLIGGFNLERIRQKDIEIYQRTLAGMGVLEFLNQFEELLKTDLEDELHKVSCPSLVFHGELDSIIPEDQNKIIAQKIPDSKFYNLSEGSHCSPLDSPYPLNKIIKEELNF